jgi:ribonucleoside-diphosphate reductase alpha chain
MASFLGAFARYQENAEHMLRVMRNHRAAAYDAEDAYEGIKYKPNWYQSKILS